MRPLTVHRIRTATTVLSISSFALLVAAIVGAGPDGTWVPGSGTTAIPGRPLGRQWQAAAADTLRGRIFVTDGYPGSRGDLWMLDLRSSPPGWHLLAPAGSGPGDRWGSVLAFDPVRNRLLLMGGSNLQGSQYYNDVWQFSPDTDPVWRPLAVSDSLPPARALHAAVYDGLRDRLIVVGGQSISSYLDDAWALALGSPAHWIRIGTGPSPGGRSSSTLVLDPFRDRVVRFAGGYSFGGLSNDVWALSLADTGTWRELKPTGPLPGARSGAAGAFDVARHALMIYGGYNGSALDGTWMLGLGDTLAWISVAATSSPGSRQWGSLLLDPQQDRMILFGGSSGTGYPQGLSQLDLGARTWTPLQGVGTPETPTVRADHSVCVDVLGGRMFVVGGYSEDGAAGMSDSWRFDLNASTWAQLLPPGAALPPSYGHVSIYDPAHDRIVIFGRAGGSSNDTWALPLTGQGWTRILPPGALPPAEEERGVVYDPVGSRMIIVGYAPTGGWDVWALPMTDGASWVNLTAAAPSPNVAVWGNSAVYDPVNGEVVVLGGSPTSQVWAFRLSPPGWRQLYSGAGPQVRGEHAVAFDDLRRRILLSGGTGSGHYLADVWEFNLDGTPGWRLLAPSGASPMPRGFHSAAYDYRNDRMVLFGGHNGSYLGDTWYLVFGGSPTAVQVSIAAAAAGDTYAELAWKVDESLVYTIERSEADAAWRIVAQREPIDGRLAFRDPTLAPGRDYRYRLEWNENGEAAHGGDVALRTLPATPFEVLGVRSAPDGPQVRVHVTDGAPTNLHVFDVTGRRVSTSRCGPLEPGVQEIGIPRPPAAGLYFLSVDHGARRERTRFVWLR